MNKELIEKLNNIVTKIAYGWDELIKMIIHFLICMFILAIIFGADINVSIVGDDINAKLFYVLLVSVSGLSYYLMKNKTQ